MVPCCTVLIAQQTLKIIVMHADVPYSFCNTSDGVHHKQAATTAHPNSTVVSPRLQAARLVFVQQMRVCVYTYICLHGYVTRPAPQLFPCPCLTSHTLVSCDVSAYLLNAYFSHLCLICAAAAPQAFDHLIHSDDALFVGVRSAADVTAVAQHHDL